MVGLRPTNPSSEHLGSLAWCFLYSVAWTAAVDDTPASNRVTEFSGEVMDTSNAAVLSKTPLGSTMSAGRVLLWSLPKLLLAGNCMVVRAQCTLGGRLIYQGQATIRWQPEKLGDPCTCEAPSYQRAQWKARRQHEGKKLTKDVPCLPQKLSLAVN